MKQKQHHRPSPLQSRPLLLLHLLPCPSYSRIGQHSLGALLAWPVEGLAGHDQRPPLGAQVRLLRDGRRIRPNNATDGHEEPMSEIFWLASAAVLA